MANTPNTQSTPDPLNQPVTLDREDRQAQRTSVEQQWGALRHLLGLPSFEELQNAEPIHRQVATRIAERIAVVRRQVAVRPQLENLLLTEVRMITSNGGLVPGGAPPASEAIQDVNYAVADAWLKIIYRNIGEADVREMINQLPLGIRPVLNANEWIIKDVDFGVSPKRRIIIDLRHPIWATGNQNQIRQRLQGRTPDEAGIRLRPPTPPIQNIPDTAVNDMFADSDNARQNVIDSFLPLREVEVTVPFGHRTMLDLPALLRLNPQIASMNPAAFTAFLNGMPIAQLNQLLRCVNVTTGQRILPFPGSLNNLVRAVFRALNRTPNPGTTLCQVSISLGVAITRRARIEQLISGAADNRELMLALAVSQGDPSSTDVLNATTEQLNNLNTRRRIVEGLADVRAFQAVQLPTQAPPGASIVELQTFRTGVNAQISTIETAESAWRLIEEQHQRDVQTDQSEMSVYESELRAHNDQLARNQTITQQDDARLAAYNAAVIAATRAGAPPPGAPPTATPLTVPPAVRPKPTQHPAPLFTPIVVGAPVACTIRSADELRTKLSEFRSLVREVDQHITSLQRRGGRLERICEELQRLQIQNIPTLFPLLVRFVNPGPPPTFLPNAIRASTDWDAIAREIERSIPGGLSTLQEYDTQIPAEIARSRVPEGSDACWAVIRRGLANQGIRGTQQDNTIEYMKARVELSPESTRDVETLSEAAFPYMPPAGVQGVEEERNVMRDWNQGSNIRRIPVITRFNPWEQYRDRLFTRERLGVAWADMDAIQNRRDLTIPQLIDIYFRTKYLLELPVDKPHRLPQTREIISFMRRLHGTILQRGRENFGVATGMKQEELKRLYEMMHVDEKQAPQMTSAERLQALHTFLMSGGGAYMEKNGASIDRMATEAYRPIKEVIENRERRRKFVSNALYGNPYLSGWGVVKGGGRIVKKLAYNLPVGGIKKVGKELSENRKPIALGAIAGVWMGPAGMLLGAGAGYAYAKIFGKEGGGNGGGNSGHH